MRKSWEPCPASHFTEETKDDTNWALTDEPYTVVGPIPETAEIANVPSISREMLDALELVIASPNKWGGDSKVVSPSDLATIEAVLAKARGKA